MAESSNAEAIFSKLGLTYNDDVAREFTSSRTVPNAISSAEMPRSAMVLGPTPEDFMKQYSSTEFNFDSLMNVFSGYCKDFNEELQADKPSKALFSSKILFEYGTFIRTERKKKGDKAIRFRFPYKKEEVGKEVLRIRTVIVSTFKDITYDKNEIDGKMVLTFRQAGPLAMVTFNKAINYCYAKNESKFMTPQCGAIFPRDSVEDMARELQIEVPRCLEIINSSAASGGQHLLYSDIACAVVCMITSTKRVTHKNIRDQIIAKIVKQYVHKGKPYSESKFNIFAKYALGGVPPGMDAGTLIEQYNMVQEKQINLRAQASAINQSVFKDALKDAITSLKVPQQSEVTQVSLRPAGPSPTTAQKPKR